MRKILAALVAPALGLGAASALVPGGQWPAVRPDALPVHVPKADAPPPVAPPSRPEKVRDEGTKVDPGVKADGADRDLRLAAARLLERMNFVPEARAESFRHMDGKGRDAGGLIRGWRLTLDRIEQDEGGQRIRVRVMASRNDGIASSFHAWEDYFYTDGRLRLEKLTPMDPTVPVISTLN